MPKLHPQQPEHFTDEQRQACVRVRLSRRDACAELYAEDYASLISSGVSPFWFLCWNKRDGVQYVRATVPGDNKRAVSRLIAGAGKGEQITHRDGNRLNLRRDNLRVSRCGTASVDCAALLARLAE